MDRPLIRAIEAYPVKVKGETMIALHDPTNLATGSVCVTPAALFLIQLFDGEHGIPDLQNAVVEAGGERVDADSIENLIRQLDENHFLDSPAFEAYQQTLVEVFRTAPVRPCSHAGLSYPSEAEALRRELDAYFVAPGGPGEPLPGSAGGPSAPAADGKAENGKAANGRPGNGTNGGAAQGPAGRVQGIVAPHIDFSRGGPCYAWAYHRLARGAKPERFVVLGTCHGPMKRLVGLTRKPYATPFGAARSDPAFVDALAKRVGDRYFDDEFAHRGEHSIEFQAVFLQRLYGPDVTVVPVLCGSLEWFVTKGRIPSETHEVQQLFGALRELAGDGTPTCVIAGADLSHVGPRFGDRKSCTKSFLDQVRRHDLEALASAESGDAEGFYRSIALNGNRMRVCGLFPIYATLSLLDGLRGKLLKYDQAVDEDGSQCVSYASVVYPSRCA